MRKTGSKIRGGEMGFTYIETLIALLIITTITGGLVLFVRGAWAGAGESAERARDLRRVTAAEKALRTASGRIAPPWWEDGPGIDHTQAGYRIGSLDGISSRILTLRLDHEDGTALVIVEGDAEPLRLPLPEGSLFALDDAGAMLTVRLGTEDIAIRATWSGRILSNGR